MEMLGKAVVVRAGDDGLNAAAMSAKFNASVDITPAQQLLIGRSLFEEGRRLICGPLAAYLERMIREAKDATVSHEGREKLIREDWNSLSLKKELVKEINGIIRRYDLAFRSPNGSGPCTLVAINDLWGGKVAFENRETKKRTGTKRYLEDLFPLTLYPADVPLMDFEIRDFRHSGDPKIT